MTTVTTERLDAGRVPHCVRYRARVLHGTDDRTAECTLDYSDGSPGAQDLLAGGPGGDRRLAAGRQNLERRARMEAISLAMDAIRRSYFTDAELVELGTLARTRSPRPALAEKCARVSELVRAVKSALRAEEGAK